MIFFDSYYKLIVILINGYRQYQAAWHNEIYEANIQHRTEFVARTI